MPTGADPIRGFIPVLEDSRIALKTHGAIADGQHVVLHCHQIWPEDLKYAGIDIFRLDHEGKIVEHWDVLQIMPNHSANDNGIF